MNLAQQKLQKKWNRKQSQKVSNWEEKLLHRQYPLRANNTDVDQKKICQWLRSSGLKAETELFILAAQDQRNYQANVMKDPRCRICTRYEETIDHLISRSPTLAPNEYLNRHNTSTGKFVNNMEPNVLKNCYGHQPEAVKKTDVTILRDYSKQTEEKSKKTSQT